MRQPGWEMAGHMHTSRLSSEQPDHDGCEHHEDERRRYGWRQAVKQQHGGEGKQARDDRRERNVRQMLQDMPKLREKVARGAADAKQMRHLADDGDVDETFNEAPHDGCGDEARDPPHTHDAKREEEEPY